VILRLTYPDVVLDAGSLEGKFLDSRHCGRVVLDSATVLKPDGQLLFTYASDALPRALCQEGYDILNCLRPSSDNRGTAAGGDRWNAPSAVLGFLDRDGRNRWCRMTGFTVDNYEAYEASLPLFAAVSSRYRDLAPQHWEAQCRFAARASRDFIIPGTVFTSVTLNRSFRTAAHTDSGNRRPGLEAMVVLAADDLVGGELIFPRYRIGVAVRPGGLLLADMHELHGNAPLSPGGLRLSVVCYARAGMGACGTVGEEWRRAARMRAPDL
jgi:Oxygenase domain of the 2OGFeDO superfamily